jgi:hypothetical protein
MPPLRSESVPSHSIVASYDETYPKSNVTKSCYAMSGKQLQGLSIITLMTHY